MMRALFSGVSGLRNHLVRLDVIGNNIANVNTVAFKSSRVTFEEAFAQLLRGASRPPGDQGGVNPIQVGLGMNIGSIDQDFSQGNLESTGQTLDLAIQGDSFFVLSDGTRRFYTRAGNFQLDADGRMVSPNAGFIAQGKNANSVGEIPSSAAVSDIILPFGKKSPAKATTLMVLAGNLDSRDDPVGSILRTDGGVLGIEQSTSNSGAGSDLNSLYANGAADAQILGMTAGSTTVTVSDGTTTQTYTYVAVDTGPSDQAFNSIKDLIAEINTDFSTMTAAQDGTTGEITMTAGGAAIVVSVTSTNSVFSKSLISLNGSLAASAVSKSDEFSHLAIGSDLLTNLRNDKGGSLGLTAGMSILVDGAVGGDSVTRGSLTVAAGTTYSNLTQLVDDTFGIINTVGVAIDDTNGGMTLNGDGGTANSLSSINVRVSGGLSAFDAVFDSRPGNFTEIQVADDVEHNVTIGVFDSIGNTHNMSLTFTKDPTVLNRWNWTADVAGNGSIVGGGTGAVTFDSSGRLLTFTFDAGATSIQLDPNTGAKSPVNIRLDSGTLGDITGLSQFAAPSNAVASSQNGYAMGNLQDVSIDESGIITGFFTNGVTQTLAQLALASFSNPSGLLRSGDNMYAESGNSGSGVIGYAGTSNTSTITPGALESSNVDLSQEFTRMITAQRGFQANARVITTADEMLAELVNLKR